ncbi:hypothetical protein DTX79_19250, partial [Bacilli bacterium]
VALLGGELRCHGRAILCAAAVHHGEPAAHQCHQSGPVGHPGDAAQGGARHRAIGRASCRARA